MDADEMITEWTERYEYGLATCEDLYYALREE